MSFAKLLSVYESQPEQEFIMLYHVMLPSNKYSPPSSPKSSPCHEMSSNSYSSYYTVQPRKHQYANPMPSLLAPSFLHLEEYGLFIAAISLAIVAHSNSRRIGSPLLCWQISSHFSSSYANRRCGWIITFSRRART